MRWTDTCLLVGKSYTLDSEGIPQPTDVKSTVFCNAFKIGSNTWSSMYEMGIAADAEIQLRTIDYSGQLDVKFKDKWYSVERASEEGDFTRLVLRHQQSDSDDSPEEP